MDKNIINSVTYYFTLNYDKVWSLESLDQRCLLPQRCVLIWLRNWIWITTNIISDISTKCRFTFMEGCLYVPPKLPIYLSIWGALLLSDVQSITNTI